MATNRDGTLEIMPFTWNRPWNAYYLILFANGFFKAGIEKSNMWEGGSKVGGCGGKHPLNDLLRFLE
jgi:hypothetical protein